MRGVLAGFVAGPGAPSSRRAPGILASIVLVCTSGAAAAGAVQRSDSATMHVSMSVVPLCTVSAAPVDFGDYDPVLAHATQPLDAEATVTTVCTPNTRLTLEMNLGSNPAGNTRRMASGTDFLRYELYQDAGRVQVWGSGQRALRFTTPANSTAPIVRTVYARMEPGQNVDPGDYDDTIEVILHF